MGMKMSMPVSLLSMSLSSCKQDSSLSVPLLSPPCSVHPHFAQLTPALSHRPTAGSTVQGGCWLEDVPIPAISLAYIWVLVHHILNTLWMCKQLSNGEEGGVFGCWKPVDGGLDSTLIVATGMVTWLISTIQARWMVDEFGTSSGQWWKTHISWVAASPNYFKNAI